MEKTAALQYPTELPLPYTKTYSLPKAFLEFIPGQNREGNGVLEGQRREVKDLPGKTRLDSSFAHSQTCNKTRPSCSAKLERTNKKERKTSKKLGLKNAGTQSLRATVVCHREIDKYFSHHSRSSSKEVFLRLVPLNADVSKLMVLYGLNPLIEIKCELSATVVQVIRRLKEYITAEAKESLQAVIGHQSEIKIAPEMQLLKATSRSTNNDPKECKEESLIVWTEGNAKGVTLNDLQLLMSFHESLYLYYYWDAAASLEQSIVDKCYYQAQKMKDKMLDEQEYEYVVKTVTDVVKRTFAKGKFRGRRNRRRRPESSPAQELGREKLKAAKTDSSDLVCELNSPFKKLLSSPKLCAANSQAAKSKPSVPLPPNENIADEVFLLSDDDLSGIERRDRRQQRRDKSAGKEKRAGRQQGTEEDEGKEMQKLPHPNEAFKLYQG